MRTRTMIAASLFCAFAHAHAALALDTIVTGLIGSATSGSWPFYIGMDKGFFADADIAVDSAGRTVGAGDAHETVDR